MASPKSNIRSFRFSDEVAAILEKQKGDSLNQKFENLVLACFWTLPKREQELKQVQEQIVAARQKLYDVQRASQEINNLMSCLRSAQSSIGIVERVAKNIADKVTEDGPPQRTTRTEERECISPAMVMAKARENTVMEV